MLNLLSLAFIALGLSASHPILQPQGEGLKARGQVASELP
jgi:hypothetical protein